MKLIIFIISICFCSGIDLQILNSGHSNCILALESQENIHGIQLSIQYNNNEISINKDAFFLLSENISFYKSFNDDGAVDLLIFGLFGEAILDTSKSKYLNLINIAFLGRDEFKGKSIVTFTDLELVGKAGMPIDFTLNNDRFIELSFVLPMRTALHDNIPNPFNKITKINYALSDSNNINLSIYNSEGILVRELFEGSQVAGYYNILWDGMDNDYLILPSGHYTLQMLTNDFIDSITMTLLK